MSSQSIYLLYFLNKLIVYTEFIFSDLLWVYFYCTQLYKENLPKKKPFFKKNKFFKPVTSYVVNSGYSLLVVNLFYKTSLENFQELSKRTEKIKKNNPIKIKIKEYFLSYIVWFSNTKLNIFLFRRTCTFNFNDAFKLNI